MVGELSFFGHFSNIMQISQFKINIHVCRYKNLKNSLANVNFFHRRKTLHNSDKTDLVGGLTKRIKNSLNFLEINFSS